MLPQDAIAAEPLRVCPGIGISSDARDVPLPYDPLRPAANYEEEYPYENQGRSAVIRGMVALLLLSRYFALSRSGMPLGWMLYLGLPITVAGVLFALRLVNLGAVWSTKVDNLQGAVQARPVALPPPEVPVSERLRELEALHAEGAISDTEYSARRLQITSSI